MFRLPRRPSADENPGSSLSMVIVTLVAMSILFGFGLATLVFRLQTHSSPQGVLPPLVLSLAGLCAQCTMVRFLIRRVTQASE